jgi:hypothetical protein
MRSKRFLAASSLLFMLVAFAGSAMAGPAATVKIYHNGQPESGYTYHDVGADNTVPVFMRVANDLSTEQTVKYWVEVADQSGNNIYAIGPVTESIVAGGEAEKSASLDGSELNVGDTWSLTFHAENNETGDVYDEYTFDIYTTSPDITKPSISDFQVIDLTDGDGTVNSGDTIRFKANVTDNDELDYVEFGWNYGTAMNAQNDSATDLFYYDHTVENASSFELTQYTIDAYDMSANVRNLSKSTHDLIFEAENTDDGDSSDGTDDSNSTDDGTDDNNSTALRDAPAVQSFDYLNSEDSTNITIENDTVTADGENATYVTKAVKSDSFDRIEFEQSGGTAAVEVLNVSEAIIKSGDYMAGSHTIDLSGLNASELRLRFELENGTAIEAVSVYGEMYDDGFGGSGLITGNFFADLPVVGDLLAGISQSLANVVNAVLGIPSTIFDGVMNLIPSL